ncbi:MAG: type I methionyl aminopeptidase [Vicinamibacterales bacterium]
MSIESRADWNGLRAVSTIAGQTLDLLLSNVRPGITTGELDAIAARYLASHGARSAPASLYGFPRTVLISVNDEVVHGIPGRRTVEAGDLVSLDVTIELGGYVADAARSIVVPPGSATAHDLVACAKAAFDKALNVARAGVRVNEIGRAVEREVRRRGFAVMKGLAGHGVGRAIHEPPSVPNEWDPHARDVLTEGLVITIEPMVAAGSGRPVEGADGWTIRTIDGSWAAHYEDTIVITRGRPIVLTGAAA